VHEGRSSARRASGLCGPLRKKVRPGAGGLWLFKKKRFKTPRRPGSGMLPSDLWERLTVAGKRKLEGLQTLGGLRGETKRFVGIHRATHFSFLPGVRESGQRQGEMGPHLTRNRRKRPPVTGRKWGCQSRKKLLKFVGWTSPRGKPSGFTGKKAWGNFIWVFWVEGPRIPRMGGISLAPSAGNYAAWVPILRD